MKRSSACIQVVAGQAGLPFSKAEAILHRIADWSVDGYEPDVAVLHIEGARSVLETLGAHPGAINQAIAAINRER